MKTTPCSHLQSWVWKKNRWSKNPSNRLRMIPKRLPQSAFDARQKLPPATTHQVGGNKNRGRTTHQIDIGLPKSASLQAILTMGKNYQYFGDTNRCPFMTSQCLGMIMPYLSLRSSPKPKIKNMYKKLQNLLNRFRNYWSISNCPKMKPLMSVGSRMQDL